MSEIGQVSRFSTMGEEEQEEQEEEGEASRRADDMGAVSAAPRPQAVAFSEPDLPPPPRSPRFIGRPSAALPL